MKVYTMPQPEQAYGPGSFNTFMREIIDGIGGRDWDDMDYRAVGDGPWATVGEAYAHAIREANRLRQVAAARDAIVEGRLAFAQRMGL